MTATLLALLREYWKPIAAVVAVLVLTVGVYLYGYQSGADDVRAEWDAAVADFNDDAETAAMEQLLREAERQTAADQSRATIQARPDDAPASPLLSDTLRELQRRTPAGD